ncbi:MAG: hypothetical protein LBP64_08965 [Tannerella sp.]|nr:hypothetical protein [Tannerella sp.]
MRRVVVSFAESHQKIAVVENRGYRHLRFAYRSKPYQPVVRHVVDKLFGIPASGHKRFERKLRVRVEAGVAGGCDGWVTSE